MIREAGTVAVFESILDKGSKRGSEVVYTAKFDDQMIAPGCRRVVDEREDRLPVNVCSVCRNCGKAAASGEVQDRGIDVGERDQTLSCFTGVPSVGETDDHRDSLNFFEMVPAFVGQASVAAGGFAVVRREDDDGILELPRRFQVCVDSADLLIDQGRERIVIADGGGPVFPGQAFVIGMDLDVVGPGGRA